jgi:tetratricopeptide (TPR) repeat protein
MADKTTISTLLQSASNFVKMQNYIAALSAYDSILSIDPHNVEAFFGKGLALSRLGRYDEALTWIDWALSYNLKNAFVWNEKGVALSKLGRNSEAIDAFNHAIEIDSNNITFKNNKDFVFKKLIDQNRLELEKSDKSGAHDWNAKGVGYFKQKKYAEALNAFSEALKLNPSDATIKNNRKNAQKNLEKSKINPVSSAIFVIIMVAIIIFFGVNIVKNIYQINPNGQLKEDEKANSISQAIDYTNPTTRDFAVGLVKKTSSGNLNTGQICDIWQYCYNNWVYVPDTTGQDYYSPASRTIKAGLRGDCDDFAILIAAVMQSIGARSRVITACNDQGDCHAYTEVFVSNDWDTFQADAASICTRYHCKSTYYHRQLDSQGNTEYWLNLDWSANYPGGKLFNDDGTYHVYYSNGFHETLTHTEPYPQ